MKIKEFIRWLDRKFVYSTSTRKTYHMMLQKIDVSDIEGSLMELKKSDMDKTFNLRITALKKYGEFLEEKYPDDELIKIIRGLRPLKRVISHPHKPYTIEQSKKLLSKAKGWKYQCIYIALNAGLRKSEIQMLNIEDIDLKNGWIIVQRGKGNKGRRVAIADLTPLIRWTKIRNISTVKNDMFGSPWLFTSRDTRPNLSSGAVFRNLSKKVGFNISLHRCRATFATELYRRTNDPVLVKEQLGHSSLETTMEYIQQFSHERAAKIKRVGRLF